MAKKKEYRHLITTPFDTGIRNFPSVAKYFLYYAPCIDSAHSQGEFDENTSIQVLEEMKAATGLKKKIRILKRIQRNSWQIFGLDAEELDFEDSRLLCDRYSKETELQALLRHIRNALAHGYVYVWRKQGKTKGDYIFLIDYDSNKKKETAKIMISMSILETWKAILENKIA